MKTVIKTVAFFVPVVLLLLWIETRTPLCSGNQAVAWLANDCRFTPAWLYLLYDVAAVVFFLALMIGGRGVLSNRTKRD